MEVVHVANDPVNMRGYVYEKDKEGNWAGETHLRKYGNITVSSHEIPLFYDNPLGGKYQAYVGGAYYAMEIFNTYYQTVEILSSDIKSRSRIRKTLIIYSRNPSQQEVRALEAISRAKKIFF